MGLRPVHLYLLEVVQNLVLSQKGVPHQGESDMSPVMLIFWLEAEIGLAGGGVAFATDSLDNGASCFRTCIIYECYVISQQLEAQLLLQHR